MAKKTFKGRPLLAGNLEGKALASKQPLNTTGSYLENLFRRQYRNSALHRSQQQGVLWQRT